MQTAPHPASVAAAPYRPYFATLPPTGMGNKGMDREVALFCRSANDPVRDAIHHHEARAAESDAQYAAEDAAHRDTLALARGGDYARLLSAMDYRDNDTRAMHALVLCAHQGHALAREAIDVLARTWAETHTEAL